MEPKDLGEHTEDEMDESELEAMLYSQIHYNCDSNLEQETDPTHTTPKTFGTPYIFTVTPVTSKQYSWVLGEDSREDLNPVEFTKTPKSFSVSPKGSLSSQNFKCKSTKTSFDSAKSIAPIPDLQPDLKFETVEFDSLSESDQADNLSTSLQKCETDFQQSKTKNCAQIQSPEVKVFGKSATSAKKCNSNLEPKFDMEAELGIKDFKSSGKTFSKHNDEIDTITVKSDRCKPPQKKTKTATTIRLDGQKHHPKQDYKKSLSMLTSHIKSRNTTQKVVVKDSGSSSTSTSSSSDSSSDSSRDSEHCTSSESDVESGWLDSTGPEVSASTSTKPELDLNWNVNSTDRQTIQIVEKSMQGVESKWKIDAADMPGSRASRYFAKKEIRCNNCGKEGHISKACLEPKKRPNCGLCGEPDHMMNRCSKQLCYNCYQTGHKIARCPAPRRNPTARCARCLMRGHEEDQCPDQWRQYHMTTTTPEDLVPRKKEVNPLVYCCNCAKRGHFAYECRRSTMDFAYPTYPFVARYDVPASGKGKTKGQSKDNYHRKKHLSDTGSDYTPSHKRFKSDTVYDVTPHQHHSHSDQALYPRGSGSAWHKHQRYYASPISRQSTPLKHHSELPHSSQWKHQPSHQSSKSIHSRLGQRPRSNFDFRGNQSAATEAPGLSRFAETFMNHRVDSQSSVAKQRGGRIRNKQQKRRHNNSQHEWTEDHQFEVQPWKSHKRQRQQNWNRSAKDGNRESYEDPVPFKRKKKSGKASEGHKGKKGRSPTMDQAASGSQHPQKGYGKKHKTQFHSKQRQRASKQRQRAQSPQPGTSSRRDRDSLIVTSSAGFRTTARTVKFNRNYKNAQY